MPYPATVVYPGTGLYPGLVLTGSGELEAVANGVANVTVALNVTLGLSASAAGTGAVAQVLAVSLPLSASATGVGALTTSVLPVLRRMNASATGAGVLVGALDITGNVLTVTTNGITSVVGHLRVTHPLTATAAGVSVVSGSVITQNLSGTITGSSSVSANLEAGAFGFLTASIHGSSTLIGWLSLPSFPATIKSRPANIAEGLLILAEHVGDLWDEYVAMASELKGVGTGGLVIDLRPPSVGDNVFTSRQRTGDTNARFAQTGAGKMSFGPGNAAADLIMERSTTRTMKVTGNLLVAGANAAEVPLVAQGFSSQSADFFQVNNSATTTQFGINSSGNARLPVQGSLGGLTIGLDTQLYRSTGSTLRVVGNFEVQGNLLMQGDGTMQARQATSGSIIPVSIRQASDSFDRISLRSDGAILMGSGTGAQDISLTRPTAGTLLVTAAITSFTGSTTFQSGMSVTGSASFATQLTAPLAPVDDSTARVATTAWYQAQGGNATPQPDGTASAGTALRWTRQDHVHPTDSTRAPISSPAFTGVPTAPTAPTGTNSTQIATTAYVQAVAFASSSGAASDAIPLMDGVAAAGTASLFSRGDHRHPTDSTRAPLASPIFTGQVLIPLGAVGTPGMAFTGDVNTGLYSAATDQFSAAASGVLAATFAAGQTQFPQGSQSSPGVSFVGSTSSGIFVPAANNLSASVSGLEQWRIDSNGQLVLQPTSSVGSNLTGLRIGSNGPFWYRGSGRTMTVDADSTVLGAMSATTGTYSSTLSVTGATSLSTLSTSSTIDVGTNLSVTGTTTLTGVATATTESVGSSNTRLATTAFVQGEFTNRLGDALPLMDGGASIGGATKYSRQDHVHPSDTSRAPLASPVFTGTPTAPTAALTTRTLQIATTAYVKNEIEAYVGTSTPLMNAGSASVGSSLFYARQDHVHPRDTFLAPINSPVFTGNPTVPNNATSNNTTSAANTAFVHNTKPLVIQDSAFAAPGGSYVTTDHMVMKTRTAVFSGAGRSGPYTIPFPSPFSTIMLTVIATHFSAEGFGTWCAGRSPAGFLDRFEVYFGASIPVGFPVRVNYIAIGQ